MAKPKLGIDEICNTHKPKNVKFKYIFTDDVALEELEALKYDMSQLDTIKNDELVQLALKCEYTEYDREVVKKAKEPTILANGIILSKSLITKTDAKLQTVMVGHFEHNGNNHVAIRFRYERFDILEIFIYI